MTEQGSQSHVQVNLNTVGYPEILAKICIVLFYYQCVQTLGTVQPLLVLRYATPQFKKWVSLSKNYKSLTSDGLFLDL